MASATSGAASLSPETPASPSPSALVPRKRSLADSQARVSDVSVSGSGSGSGSVQPTASPSVPAQNRRKLHKVSRACDHCKAKKARCSGTLPCATCSARGLSCGYGTKYSRGRPPTPPPAESVAVCPSPASAASASGVPELQRTITIGSTWVTTSANSSLVIYLMILTQMASRLLELLRPPDPGAIPTMERE